MEADDGSGQGRLARPGLADHGEGPAGVDLRTFEFSKSFVQIATRYYNLTNGAAYIPEVQHTGSYTSESNRLTFTVERCDPQYDIDVPSLSYTASAKGLSIIETLEGEVSAYIPTNVISITDGQI